MVLLCNQSVGEGKPVDELLDGLAESQLKGQWQGDPVSEQRRLALLPVGDAPAWDDLMVQPRYMQALRLLP
jgi:beta-N-acetylhexosaminidase